MGVTSSKNSLYFVDNKVKKNETLQTVLNTKDFKFGLLIDAKKSEIERIQERWSDFLSKIKDEFIYVTTTRNPQTVKIVREGEELFLNVSTKISIREEDLSSFTKMFNSMESTINSIDNKDVVGLSVKTSYSSSLNLLVKS